MKEEKQIVKGLHLSKILKNNLYRTTTIVETLEEARALGVQRAKEAAKNLKLHLPT